MKPITLTIALVASLMTTAAQADGFKCHTESGLNAKVFNAVQPDEGTRNPARMVVSDSAIQFGRKTIAVFSADKNTLVTDYSGKYAEFIGKIDLRTSELAREGEYIMGTRLGQLANVQLSVDFTYGRTTEHNAALPALLTIEKRNGEILFEEAVCFRYLKGA